METDRTAEVCWFQHLPLLYIPATTHPISWSEGAPRAGVTSTTTTTPSGSLSALSPLPLYHHFPAITTSPHLPLSREALDKLTRSGHLDTIMSGSPSPSSAICIFRTTPQTLALNKVRPPGLGSSQSYQGNQFLGKVRFSVCYREKSHPLPMPVVVVDRTDILAQWPAGESTGVCLRFLSHSLLFTPEELITF